MKYRLVLCICVLSLLLSGVAYGEVKDKPVVSITLVSMPQRIVYDVGEEIDLYGMRVKVTFTDGEEYIAGYSDLTCEGYNPQLEGSQLVVARYGEYTVPFSVTVKRGSLKGLQVRIKQTDSYWIAGKTLTKDNFTVTAEYDVGSAREITDYVFNPSTLTAGRNVIIISYRDKTAQVVIDARENSCQSIRIENPGTGEFLVGEPFNWRGLKVIAHYLDNSEKDVTSECNVRGAVTSREGTQYVEVTYNEKVVTYPVNVIKMVFERLDVSKWDAKETVYVYYKDREDPIAVGKEGVYVTDDNKTGIRTFIVTSAGKTYQTNVEIPVEERRYINSKRITVQVPIGINLVTNNNGELGYISKTPLQSHTEGAVTLNIKPHVTIPRLTGLPVTLKIPNVGIADLVLDIPNEKYAETKVQEYYGLDVDLEVH